MRLPVSVVIPTYGRDSVLTDTIKMFLGQSQRAAELLVVDQTETHDPSTTAQLEKWEAEGAIRWIRLAVPSQPVAMNRGLLEASNPLVLFIDDDIRIDEDFVAAHYQASLRPMVGAVIGQILQPGEVPLSAADWRTSGSQLGDLDFPFRSDRAMSIRNGMSGNMSVKRELALSIGGFDENFLAPVAYRFDSDFSVRLVDAGFEVFFDPRPRIHHLRAERGGTRISGSHLTSASPIHGIGDYYYALRRGIGWETVRYVLRRPFREVMTRFHLRHPWWIPVKFIGELRALARALVLWRRGPKLLPGDGGITKGTSQDA